MDSELIDALSDEFGLESSEFESSHHGVELDLNWRPKLNPTQEKVYDTTAEYILSYGERGSGKSVSALHKAVHHAVNNKNALVFIIVREVGQATEGGAWSKLQIDILPQWKNGNFDRIAGKRLDKGCGVEYTAPKLDPLDKKPYIWITNRFGGYSQIKLISLFVGDHVEDKVKGKEPSFIFLDEAQTTESDEYFKKLVQQMGRRQDITGIQQIVYCCNPKGPSHWLYERFFCHAYDEDGNTVVFAIDEETGHPIDPETGKPVFKYAVFHVPTSENIQNLPAGYWENVLEAVRNDPIEYARMVEGEWIDKPEGDALFKDEWNDAVHLRGDASKGLGLHPAIGYPLIIGWDPGAAHTSVHVMQFVITPKKLYWAVIDEINCVGKYVPYSILVPRLIRRLQYWEAAATEATGALVRFKFIHISDSSAFNQFRAKEGSFDAQDIEDISKEYVAEEKLEARFVIKMKACPKAPHSVEARVRLAKDGLMEESLVISAMCNKTRAALMNLECDPDNRNKPKRSKHLHPFDSMTYPMLYYNSGNGRRSTMQQQAEELPPELYKIGR